VVYDPDLPEGRVVSDPVALIDLGPTVLDFAGIPVPGRSHARSLRPAMAGVRDPDRVVPSFYRQNVSVRQGRYRLVRYGDGSTQLFDVDEDYWNLRDLGEGHPAHARLFAALERVAADCGFDIHALGTEAHVPEDEVETDD